MTRRLALLLIALLPGWALADENSPPRVWLNTSKGKIVLELNPEKAPITVANFLDYVRQGYYDGTVFHRVMDNFMIQGGGFALTDGQLVQKPTGSPIRNESQNGLSNLRGTIAMARINDPDSATTQFFINVVDNPMLDYPNNGGYAVFGRVVEGMDVVDQIRTVRCGVKPLVMLDPRGNEQTSREPNVPREPLVISSAHLEGEAPRDRTTRTALSAFSKQLWLCPLIAFAFGSIPFGLLIARSRGIDIRRHGSGNIGATNVWRTLGKKFGIPCLILDMLKGLVPVVLAVNLIQITGRPVQLPLGLPQDWCLVVADSDALIAQIIHILTALFAVLGHNYSPWVAFRGGKGIATSAGVILGLMPFAVLLLFAVWLLLFFTTRYVSIASMGAAASLPLLTLYGSWHHGRLQDGSWNKPLLGFAIIIAVLAIWKHRSNIKRLIEGTENRFTRKSKTGNA